MGLAMQGLKRYDSARIYLRQAINLDGNNPIYWTNIAGVFKQLNRLDSASYYYKKLVFSRTDANAQAFFMVGSYLDDLKEYDSAIVYFKKVIQLDKSNAPAYSNICAAFIRLEKFDSAIVYCQKAVQLDAQYESATLNLGLAFRSVAKYDSAIVYLLNLIKLDVKKSRNYFRLACVYALNNQNEQAILYLKQAYERGYKNFDALLSDPDLVDLRNFKGYQDLLDKYIPDWRNR
jgi:tetratricopeptide (TPR) repeat protein